MARWETSFTIEASGGPGTTPQTSAAAEIPQLPPDSITSLQVTLSGLAGGTAPTVTPDIELSNDGTNFVAGAAGSITGPVALSANGTQLMEDADAVAVLHDLTAFKYLRLKGTGGGTAAPTAWTLSAKLVMQG